MRPLGFLLAGIGAVLYFSDLWWSLLPGAYLCIGGSCMFLVGKSKGESR